VINLASLPRHQPGPQVYHAQRVARDFHRRGPGFAEGYAEASAEVAEVKLLFICIFKPKIISYLSVLCASAVKCLTAQVDKFYPSDPAIFEDFFVGSQPRYHIP